MKNPEIKVFVLKRCIAPEIPAGSAINIKEQMKTECKKGWRKS